MIRFVKTLLAMCVCVVSICCFSIVASAEDLEISGRTSLIEDAEYDTVTISSGILNITYESTVTIDTLIAENDYCYIWVYRGTAIINTLIVKSDECDIDSNNSSTITINSIILDNSNCDMGIYVNDNSTATITDLYIINGSVIESDYITNTHTMTLQEATDATCDDGGYSYDYYTCEDCDTIIYIDDDGNYIIGTIDDITLTATGHFYKYILNDDGTHMITCEDCDYEEIEYCTYDEGVLNDDGTYYTYTCEYCSYYYTEDVEEDAEDEEEEEDSADEDTNSEEDTEDTTDDTDSEENTDTSTNNTSDDTDITSDTTDTDTTTDTSDDTNISTSTYTNAYIQYIGGILMSGNTSTSTVEDVSTGAGVTAEGSASGSALAVVSLVGLAVVMTRKRR